MQWLAGQRCTHATPVGHSPGRLCVERIIQTSLVSGPTSGGSRDGDITARGDGVRPAPAERHCGSGECVCRRFRVTRAQVAAPGGRAVNAPAPLYAISAPTGTSMAVVVLFAYSVIGFALTIVLTNLTKATE